MAVIAFGAVALIDADGFAMKILFAADVPADRDSGAAGTEWQTIQALRELGHDVDEIWADDMRRRIAHGNLHYLLELPREYDRAISDRCRQRDYDVIHVNQSHCYRAALHHRETRRRGVFILRSHGLDDHMERILRPWRTKLNVVNGGMFRSGASLLMNLLLRRRDRNAYGSVDGIIISSSVDRDYLIHECGVDPARVALIPQAPAEVFFSPSAPLFDESRSKKLLHVGGFAYWKGVHAVADAVNRLAAGSGIDWTMTWVCRQPEQTSVRALLSEAAAPRVTLRSWIPQEELRDVYDAHGIFLAPSLFDGFGKVFLEAMARGMIVIGTRTGGMIDAIEDGRNGFLVPFNDGGAIAERVQSIMRNPEAVSAVSPAAVQTASAYTWRRVAMETAAFYETRLNSRVSGRG